jgi:hypothetical protein
LARSRSTRRIQSTAAGTGTVLPFRVLVGTTEVFRATTAANFLIGTSTDNATDKLQVNGTVSATAINSTRVNARVSVTTSASSLTPDISAYDSYQFTALAATLTINATTGGTPLAGNKLIFRFKDNGTPQTISWTTSGANSFRAIGVTLPTTTTANKVTYVGCIYNAAESFWDVVAVTTQV